MPASPLSELPLDAPVGVLSGVGPERVAQLARLGVRTIEDLLLHRPRRYEDRRHVLPIAGIQEKGSVATRGRIVALGVKFFRRRTRSVFEVILDDGTGRLHCRWWNMPFLEEHFQTGQDLMVYGRVVELRPRTIDHPETEVIETGDEAFLHVERIVPVYPLTEGLTQRWLRARLWTLVRQVAPRLPEPHPGVALGGLPTRAAAVRSLHFPEEPGDAELARRRLALDEFIALQWAIQERRRRLFARARGYPCGGDNRLMRPFLAGLGFRLTAAQTAVLREIREDMGSGRPMRRLVQGDVGCGKTVVAAAAALMALEGGYSVALMAPTEILARQHWVRFRAWFEPLGIPVDLWTAERKTNAGRAPDPHGGVSGPSLVVGTHALIAEGFAREGLGLTIIDEQHKFGVAQREQLVRKGRFPHLLVMTATPIPRTLALTLYGDLDVSVIAASPPGRGPVRTYLRSRDRLPKVWAFVREQVEKGRQAYVVFPRVDEDDGGDTKAVLREQGVLRGLFAPFTVAVLHGRMSAEDKERVMAGFREGRVQVLVATLVIEVGIDVPNATVMVIENAERFGLAQVHQLRGRIGRGGLEGHCILVTAKDDEATRARLGILTENADGFAIAEADLRLRGPGELLGQAQSGMPSLRFGDLVQDRELLEMARRVASALLDRTRPASGGGGGGGGDGVTAPGRGDDSGVVPGRRS